MAHAQASHRNSPRLASLHHKPLERRHARRRVQHIRHHLKAGLHMLFVQVDGHIAALTAVEELHVWVEAENAVEGVERWSAGGYRGADEFGGDDG